MGWRDRDYSYQYLSCPSCVTRKSGFLQLCLRVRCWMSECYIHEAAFTGCYSDSEIKGTKLTPQGQGPQGGRRAEDQQ